MWREYKNERIMANRRLARPGHLDNRGPSMWAHFPARLLIGNWAESSLILQVCQARPVRRPRAPSSARLRRKYGPQLADEARQISLDRASGPADKEQIGAHRGAPRALEAGLKANFDSTTAAGLLIQIS